MDQGPEPYYPPSHQVLLLALLRAFLTAPTRRFLCRCPQQTDLPLLLSLLLALLLKQGDTVLAYSLYYSRYYLTTCFTDISYSRRDAPFLRCCLFFKRKKQGDAGRRLEAKWGDPWESARRKGKRERAKLQHSRREESARYSIYLLY